MQTGKLLAGVVGLLTLGTAPSGLTGTHPGCETDNAGLDLPESYCAQAVATDIGVAGQLAVADSGDIYVALRDQDDEPGGVLAMRDTDGNGRMDEFIRFGEQGVSGIALRDGYLYVGEDSRILRVALHEKHLGPNGDAEVIAAGFDAEHPARAFEPGPDDSLFIQAGDSIWRFDDKASGQQPDDADHRAKGTGPAAALTWNPGDDRLYALIQGGIESGDAESISEDFDSWTELALPTDFRPRDLLIHTGEQIPEDDGPTAFISLEEDGFSRIVTVPLDDGRVNVSEQDWQTFTSTTRHSDQQLTGLAQGPDGSVYVSDAGQGIIWRIQRRGEEGKPQGGWRLLPLPGLS